MSQEQSLKRSSERIKCEIDTYTDVGVMVYYCIKSSSVVSMAPYLSNNAMKILKAIWQFCSYLFVPQWGSKRRKMDDV